MASDKNREIPLCVPCLGEVGKRDNGEQSADPEAHGNGDEYIEGIVSNLRECVETGWISSGGRFIAELESKAAAYLGLSEAVGVQSGTAGLHTALRLLGVGPGDEVIVPTLSFIAAVNPVKYLGAEPVFMDCDESLCMDPDKLESFLLCECRPEERRLINNTTGREVKAIVAVHVFGNTCDMDRIMGIAEAHGIKVLEDATEALGSRDGRGRFAGTIGDAGVFSFNANKIITTGGGGMIVSRDSELLERARYLSAVAKDDPMFYVHDEVGYNYRILNIQAALGVSQIDRLEDFIAVKARNYEEYERCLAGGRDHSSALLPFREGTRPNYWFYSIDLGDRRDEALRGLSGSGIGVRPVWGLIHRQKPYEHCRSYMIERAYYYEASILNLPCSVNLSRDDIVYICDALRAYL